MMRKTAVQYLENHLGASVLFVSLIPYGSLLIYLRFGMHSVDAASLAPHPAFLLFLFAIGVALPLCGIAIVLRRLIRQRQEFDLRMLLACYFSLVLVFATGFAVLQASSIEPSIKGMVAIWDRDSSYSFGEHWTRVHRLYFDSLYLSLITITTVGYGDLTPASPWAKILASLEGLAGVGFLGLALGHYFSVCLHQRDFQEAQSQPTENIR